jgi:ParB family chromosome partitioning protein
VNSVSKEPKPLTKGTDRYSKALLRMGKMAPEAFPLQNAQMLRTDRIRSNPRNPRLNFDPQSLQELGESMLNVGIIEPLVVRHTGDPDGTYEIVVGERRWRAAKQVNIPELPCLVRELDDVQAFELALSENILREELSPIDEAKCYQHMLDMGIVASLREIARKLGVSHTRVQQKMNLLGLERGIQRLVATRVATPGTRKITEGHARHLLRLPTDEERWQVLDLIFEHNWNTRETASEVSRRLNQPSWDSTPAPDEPTAPVAPAKATRTRYQALSPQTRVEPSLGTLDIRIQYDNQDSLVQELESLLRLAQAGVLLPAGTTPEPSAKPPGASDQESSIPQGV